jgi:hypothetical protein
MMNLASLFLSFSAVLTVVSGEVLSLTADNYAEKTAGKTGKNEPQSAIDLDRRFDTPA